MHLYALTLQQTTAISKAIYGNFSAGKAQEIIIARGKYLELYRPVENSDKLQLIISHEVFGVIRSIAPFRLTGTSRDYIIVGSDSGRVVILQYDGEKNEFKKIHQETYGKTGCRRVVPGQYIACDPKGRAFMLCSVEKQKFVYILNRDTSNNLTISSPLEAHKSHTILFDVCGLDVGYENPMFACIEVDYGDHEEEDSAVVTGQVEKFLTFYEMDLGLNHVVRKLSDAVPLSAHAVISVPGSPDGPSGVIVCCEDLLIYRNTQQTVSIECYFPKRKLEEDKPVMVNSFFVHKQKDFFFFLVQTELGDLFKVTLNFTKDEVHGMSIQYLDSIAPAISLCILKSGYLFAASEFGNHYSGFYNVVALGDEDPEPAISNSGMGTERISFIPHELTNLSLVEELENMACITDLKVDDLTGDGHPQIYTIHAANTRSTLRCLRHGLSVTQLAISQLPGKPTGVWTIKNSVSDEFDKYIVISFINATLVLSVGETVLEVKDSGLDSTKATLHVGLLEDDAIIQVCPTGIRHIRKDKRINIWNTEGKIVRATSNTRQVVIALSGGEIIYFELDSVGQLAEIEKVNLETDIVCMDLAAIPEGRQRFKFLAVGFIDQSVRLFSLEPESCLTRLAAQALPALADSVCLQEMTPVSETESEAGSELYLHVGLANGFLLKTAVDQVTGSLTDTRTRFLGAKGVKLFKITLQKQSALLALSSRPWISYNYIGKNFTTPLSYDALDFATTFSSPACSDGIVGISNAPGGSTLRIIMADKLGELFNQKIVPLRYSPRKMLVHALTHNLVIIESDHRVFSDDNKNAFKDKIAEIKPEFKDLEEKQIGVPKLTTGCWGSCIRIVEPIKLETFDLIELQDNQCAVSLLISSFEGSNEEFLLVGAVKDYIPKPRSFTACYVHVYLFLEGGKLKHHHSTQVDHIPYSLCGFKGKLIAGVGTTLRLYEFGKKKLLKKCEMIDFAAGINSITTMGERIYITDLADSFHVLRYKEKENQFYEFADDVVPRWMTSSVILDYNTLAGGDKFENFFVVRLPQNVEEDIEEDPMTYKFKWETGNLNGAAYKMDLICNYYYGEMITTVQKASLGQGTGNEVIVFGTSMGSIGAFLPFETKEDVDFFVHLEMYLRIEALPLCGRDHLMYRSFNAPVKNVIDGDLCEQYSKLDYDKQKVLGQELDRTPTEVFKKLEEIRNKIL